MKSRRVKSAFLLIAAAALLIFCAWLCRDRDRYGWAKHLNGRTAVAVVFADDAGHSWDGQQAMMEEKLKYVNIACRYLEEAASEYGAHTALICPEGTGDELVISFDTEAELTGDYPEVSAIDELLLSPEEEERREWLMQRNFCSGIVYLFFVNTPEDYEYTSQTYMWMAEGNPEDEFTIMYNYVNRKKEGPTSIAHEMLHSFGAPDLYTSREEGYDLGITDEYVNYLREVGSDDIMFSVYGRDGAPMSEERVEKSLSPVDAYYTGLINECEDVKRFGLGASIYSER